MRREVMGLGAMNCLDVYERLEVVVVKKVWSFLFPAV